MVKLRFTYILFLFLIGLQGFAQQSTALAEERFPVFTCDDDTVYSDEFLRVFHKNRRSDKPVTQQEIEDYLDLYVKFKLKVSEAYARQMDTVPQFIQELEGYRKQLAQPYLTDKTVTAQLVKEAYDRSQFEVRASHFMVQCSPTASPQDTQMAYDRIMGYRTRIVEKGEDFSKLAQSFSEDESARVNKGDLGYFTVFDMIYPFETAAYSMEIGEVSQPIRTMFGYHLVYLADKRPALGDVKVAHIMIKFYNDDQIDSTKRRIDAVYEKLQAGADWRQTVEEFSEDFSTNSTEGELNWFRRTTKNVPEEFKNMAYTLKNDGDISEPFKTRFGWHIMKRVAAKPLPSYEQSKAGLQRQIERDSRSERNKNVVVERFKRENNYREVAGVNAVIGKIHSDLVAGSFTRPQAEQAVLFAIGETHYTDSMFYDYLDLNKGVVNQELGDAIRAFYKQYVNKSNMAYEEDHLEEKHEDFKHIIKEYKDGILLFDLTDREVWSKAVTDTAGLADFYAANQDQYRWERRAKMVVYSCKNKKVAKKVRKLASHGTSAADILSVVNKKDALSLTAEPKLVEDGKDEILNSIEWKEGVYDLGVENERMKFAHVSEILPAQNKPLEKNMGQATSDYQSYLEKQWLTQLRAKYGIEIFDDNVKRLYN